MEQEVGNSSEYKNCATASANEQLKIHDKMQQESINVAAHELRTPIQPILSITEILHSRIKDSRGHTYLMSSLEMQNGLTDFQMRSWMLQGLKLRHLN